MKQKLIILFGMVIFILYLQNTFCFGENESIKDDFIDKQSKLIEEGIGANINKDSINQILPGYSIKGLLGDLIQGKFKFSPQWIYNNISKLFIEEFMNSIKFGVKIIAAIFIISLINLLKSSFATTKIGEIAFACGYTIIALMLFNLLWNGISMTKEILSQSSSFIYSSYPVLMLLMMYSGAITSTVILKPFYFFSIFLLFSLLKNIIFPLIMLQISIAFISNFSEKTNLKSVGTLIKQVNIWLVGIFLTIFMTIMGLQGSLGYSIDSLTAKTAKFTIGTMIPFAGKYIADAAETVLGCTILLKNSAGIVVLIILVCMCAVPLIKMITLTIFFKILTLASDILSDKRYTSLLNEVSNIFLMLSGIIATIIFIFYISICFVMGSAKFF